jgi:hypothetical protein
VPQSLLSFVKKTEKRQAQNGQKRQKEQKGKKTEKREKRDKKTLGKKETKKDKRDKKTGIKETKIQGQKGQNCEQRSLISQIVKIQVHAQWVKSDRTIESALKSVWRSSLSQNAFVSSILLSIKKLLCGSGYLLPPAISALISKDDTSLILFD